jgi:outer membrane protein assembly factor BamB
MNMKLASALLAAAALALSAAAAPAPAGDWPRWRGPHGNSIVTGADFDPAALQGTPKQVWSAKIGHGYSALSVAEGRAYTLGNADKQDTIHCFDAITGKELWTHRYPADPGSFAGPRATPWLEGGRCYTMSYWGDVFCLDAATGKIIWQKNVAKEIGAAIPQWGLASSTLVDGNQILLNIGTAGCAVDKASGRLLWSTGKEAAGYATPVLFPLRGQPHAAVFGAKFIHVVGATDGKVVAKHPWETKYDVNAADPVIDGTRLFISSGYGKGCALLDVGGPAPKEVWRNEKIRNHFSSSIFIDGHLYGCDGSAGGGGDIVCLEWATGQEKWRHKTGFGSLIAVNGFLVFLNEKGELIVVKAQPTAAEEVARGKIIEGGKSWTAPAFANGRLYCRNDQGQVVCIEASKR